MTSSVPEYLPGSGPCPPGGCWGPGERLGGRETRALVLVSWSYKVSRSFIVPRSYSVTRSYKIPRSYSVPRSYKVPRSYYVSRGC